MNATPFSMIPPGPEAQFSGWHAILDYLARLEAAGFRDITIEAEAAYRTDPGLENLRSVRVRAEKPA